MKNNLNVVCKAAAAEKHNTDVTTLLFHKGKLYSGGDDGMIKLWNTDLHKLAQIQAFETSVYDLTASDDTLYSCSSDGSIKLYDLNTLKELSELANHENVEYWRVKFVNGHLYVGDNEGNVTVYRDNKFYGQVNVAEPIKDMMVLPPFVLTVQDSDLVITEVKVSGQRLQWETYSFIAGRTPVTLVGNKLIGLIARDGKDILLHSTDRHTGFKEVAKVEHGSDNDMVINALCGAQWGDEQVLFSGGWDKVIKKWNYTDKGLSFESSVNVDVVVNVITAAEPNVVFVGGSDGHIIKVNSS